MIFPSRSQLASKQITRTGRAEAVTKEGLAATLLPARQPDRMGPRHPLRPVRPRSLASPLRNGSLCCIFTAIWSVPRIRRLDSHYGHIHSCVNLPRCESTLEVTAKPRGFPGVTTPDTECYAHNRGSGADRIVGAIRSGARRSEGKQALAARQAMRTIAENEWPVRGQVVESGNHP